MILAKYLAKNSDLIEKRHKKGVKLNVLELGSGTGILGIYSACLGWNTVLTDLPEISTSILKKNLNQNQEVILLNNGAARIVTLDW